MTISISLKTYYRAEFLPLISTTVGEVARCFGASPKEASELAIAAEEAAQHIVDCYPGNGFAEQFEVNCDVAEGGLRVVFSNMGLPVNPQALPQYESNRPEETLDGLGLFLIEKLMDRFEFVNEGRKGWRTILFKRIANLRLPPPGTDAAGDAGAAAAKEKLVVLRADASHVPDIVELAYHTYGYTYAKELFYYADPLRAAVIDGSVQSFVALNPAGKVVAQMAVLRSRSGSDLAEIGALMVQPDYRRSTALLKLIKAVIHGAKNAPGSPAMGETNLVTTHTLSQRVCGLFQFKPMALKLSTHARAHFTDLTEESKSDRESLLHAVVLVRPIPPVRLHVPPRHAEITRRLFARAGIEIQPPESAPLIPVHTELDVEANAEFALTTIRVHRPGADLVEVLHKILFEHESDGAKTVYIQVPGWLPVPESLEAEIRSLRVFFCGWIAAAPDRWWLLYTRLNAQRFDFSGIQLFDSTAVELRDYIENQFTENVL